MQHATVTQFNADTGETFTGTGRSIIEALTQVVSNGQASTRHRAEDARWITVLAESLYFQGEAMRGFATYTVTHGGVLGTGAGTSMSAQLEEAQAPVTVGSLSDGDTGTVTAGKFEGRRFRVRHVGSTGRTVWLDWIEHGTNGVVRASTLVTR